MTGPPPRPFVPVTLPMLVVLLFSLRGFEPVLAGEHPRLALGISLLVMAAMALAGTLLSRRGLAHAVVAFCAPLLACALLGLILACALLGGVARASARMVSTPISALGLEVDADPVPTSAGWWSRACASDASGRVGEVWLSSSERHPRGTRLRCVGRFAPDEEDGWGDTSASEGVCGEVRVSKVLSRDEPSGPLGLLLRFRGSVVDAIGPGESRERALLAGFVCGERSEAKGQGISDEFATCGLAHLIAVSGAHLAIVAAVLTSLLGRARLRPLARVLLLGLALGAYVVFCGCPVSAVRAWAMWVISSASHLAGRRAHPLSAVCVAALAIVTLDPSASGDLGYLLSVSCVIGLLLFSGYLRYALGVMLPAPLAPGGSPRRMRRLRTVLSPFASSAVASLVSLAVTAPLTTEAFGRLSLVSPMANALVAPLFALDMVVGLVAAALACVPVVGPAALSAFELVSHPLLGLVDLLSSVPLASVPVQGPGMGGEALVVGLGAVAVVFWPELSRRRMGIVLSGALLCVLVPLVCWRYFAPPRICVLDVGQGDAILVQDGASAVLVDTGPAGAIGEALARSHVFHLDAVVLTHLHDDHVGGMGDLGGRVEVGRVFVAPGVDSHESDALAATILDETGRASDRIGYGDRIRVGRFDLRCVWPRRDVTGEENGDSVCLLARYEGGSSALSVLLMGDAERDQLSSVVSVGDVGDVDVLKVGHHGSKVSISADEAAAIDPEVSVASAGKDNDYGHPASECVETLEAAGSEFVCTIQAGDVTLEPGVAGPRVSCSKGGACGGWGLV